MWDAYNLRMKRNRNYSEYYDNEISDFDPKSLA